MSETSEVQWQPARIRPIGCTDVDATPLAYDLTKEEIESMLHRVVRIRPADPRRIRLSDFRCYVPGVRMYEIHPDDCVGDCFICEHEILTD
jgi:NAD-dependent dihydropyrimidine dehydrogenase PreA subunit